MRPVPVGEVFGRLRVISSEIGPRGHTVCVCVCDCGASKKVRIDALKRGLTKSCGCLYAERKRYASATERKKAKAARYYRKNKDRARVWCAKWGKRNPKKVKDNQRRQQARIQEQLTDRYLIKAMTNRGCMLQGMRASDIPAPLIEAKRALLKVKRLLKEAEHGTQEDS